MRFLLISIALLGCQKDSPPRENFATQFVDQAVGSAASCKDIVRDYWDPKSGQVVDIARCKTTAGVWQCAAGRLSSPNCTQIFTTPSPGSGATHQ